MPIRGLNIHLYVERHEGGCGTGILAACMPSQPQSGAIQVGTPLPKACYVILHIGVGPSLADQSPSPLVVTDARSRFDLSGDIWIERLDEELAKHIQTACEPSHHNIDKHPYDRHLYAFVRRVPDVEKGRYEGMGELFAVAALSRLIHPTSVGSRYCALVHHFGLGDSAIQAIQFAGVSPDVFLDQNNRRDWLSVEDGKFLRKLMRWVPSDKPMHGRIHRAYWYHEYAMRSYHLDARWPLIVSGFEALMNTGNPSVTRQFRFRVGRLAAEFNVPLTERELGRAYDLRSKLVHAENFLFGLDSIMPRSQHNALYGKLESLLRVTIKTCLLDDSFAAHFRDRAAVEARWPLPKPPKRKGWICRIKDSVHGTTRQIAELLRRMKGP